ncbi:hypothetical protein PVAP13_4NG023750 [Panicum virgatum]|uniref:Uncharacterized protein n=1 Tax=Panicum virgatum TaxID=38727 RepID=A0A8T0T428_PANVG|nr:hypothetical protein PVAP13_4NG023750 [Panicum virgatum]
MQAAQDRGRAWCCGCVCRSKVQGTSEALLNPAFLEPEDGACVPVVRLVRCSILVRVCIITIKSCVS